MNDLDNLRPEVRLAVVHADEFAMTYQHGFATKRMWETIRAELLRLTERNAALEAKATRDFEWNTELLAANKQAEAELAALKARIAGSDAGIVTQTVSHLGSDGADTTTVEAYPPKVFHHTAIGQRVRLVVEK